MTDSEKPSPAPWPSMLYAGAATSAQFFLFAALRSRHVPFGIAAIVSLALSVTLLTIGVRLCRGTTRGYTGYGSGIMLGLCLGGIAACLLKSGHVRPMMVLTLVPGAILGFSLIARSRRE